jgi:TonB family protein
MLAISIVGCSAIAFAQTQNGSAAQSQPAARQTVHVSAAEMTGMTDNKVLPQYPKEALSQGIEGDVIFKVVVDETGKIVHSDVVQGNPMLVAASKDALQTYHFRPYLSEGTPVRVNSEMGFHFSLTKDGDSTNGQVECMTEIPQGGGS